MDWDYGDQRPNQRRGQADLHDAPGPIFRRWKDERRNGRLGEGKIGLHEG
jgi:hypothetical protein